MLSLFGLILTPTPAHSHNRQTDGQTQMDGRTDGQKKQTRANVGAPAFTLGGLTAGGAGPGVAALVAMMLSTFQQFFTSVPATFESIS